MVINLVPSLFRHTADQNTLIVNSGNACTTDFGLATVTENSDTVQSASCRHGFYPTMNCARGLGRRHWGQCLQLYRGYRRGSFHTITRSGGNSIASGATRRILRRTDSHQRSTGGLCGPRAGFMAAKPCFHDRWWLRFVTTRRWTLRVVAEALRGGCDVGRLHHPDVLPMLCAAIAEARFVMTLEWTAGGNINELRTGLDLRVFLFTFRLPLLVVGGYLREVHWGLRRVSCYHLGQIYRTQLDRTLKSLLHEAVAPQRFE